MAEILAQLIDRLVEDFFPWGQGGEPRVADLDRRARHQHVLGYLARARQPHVEAATLLARLVEDALATLAERGPATGPGRRQWRVDHSELGKRPEAILLKMARRWAQRGVERPPPVGFDNLAAMTDLGRFRVVCGFVSDVDEARDLLTQSPVSPAALAALWAAFEQIGPPFPADVAACEPAAVPRPLRLKGRFRARNVPQVTVEVQIMTELARAWDCAQHVLVYEPERAGARSLGAQTEAMRAWGEVLLAADLAWDRIRRQAMRPDAPS